MDTKAKTETSAEAALRMLEDSLSYYIPEPRVVTREAAPKQDYVPYADAA